METKVYIQIVQRGDDCGRVVQYAHGVKQAQHLIENVMPKLLQGYYYRITEA